MADETSIRIRIPGARISSAALPNVLGGASRSVASPGSRDAEDAFLPPGTVTVEAAYDLSRASRAAATQDQALEDVAADKVIALELEDGVTVFIRADKLQEDLQRTSGELVDQDGTVKIGELGTRGPASRGMFGDLVRRVFVLDVSSDRITALAKRKAAEWLGAEVADLSASRLGTKALMWAIESQLAQGPGLYRWADGGELQPVNLAQLEKDAAAGPMLVFVHGTGSSTAGFHDLQGPGSRAEWSRLSSRFRDRIYAFEHRTLSESPLENALALARALPAGAAVNLVSHSRGGLVSDLFCLGEIDPGLIENYRRFRPGLDKTQRRELEQADREDRELLRELSTLSRAKGFRIDRYVRVASPARGTRLASANLDLFLSGLLSLIGTIPHLAASPIYSAFKRVVLEIAKNRMRPDLVPGIEAMLPESPVGELLQRATARVKAVGVIAGDIQGGGFFKRLGVLLTDVVIFDSLDNDLVVDTDSMYAGVARAQTSRVLFEQGPNVNHFRYFANRGSREALCDWLTLSDPALAGAFQPLAVHLPEALAAEKRAQRTAAARGLTTPNLPIAIVLPGIMGSHLVEGKKRNRVWFDQADLIRGRIGRLQYATDGVAPESLLDAYYGGLCEFLSLTHRVVPFAYDWRKPLQHSGAMLAQQLKELLDETEKSGQPVRILAHSMGGLVTRAMAAADEALWKRLMQRDGSRFIMLGTPNRGSHSMVETLVGKSDSVRQLARIDVKNSLQDWLTIIAEFRGALQLLPAPGFKDTGNTAIDDYFLDKTWNGYKDLARDFWFGNGVVGEPPQAALAETKTAWGKLGKGLPEEFKDQVVYVFGQGENTPCGITTDGGRLRMLGTPHGDGTVTWESGKIEGIGKYYSMPVLHGDMAASSRHFNAIHDLLLDGNTSRLDRRETGRRGTEADTAAAAPRVVYDAGPVPYPTPEEVTRSLMGAGRPRAEGTGESTPVLKVRCTGGDLRYGSRTIMAGHYEGDTISGAEAAIDSLVDGALTVRHQLGLYAGPVGTATVVELVQNRHERGIGKTRGALITGLGEYGKLSTGTLEEAVRSAASRFLLHCTECEDDNGSQEDPRNIAPREVKLSTLLLGYNSTTNISIEDSITAILRGVLEANHQFAESKQRVRIADLEFIELYQDTAITAARSLQGIADRLNRNSERFRTIVEAARELHYSDGIRSRLRVQGQAGYWPRLIVTDAGGEDCSAGKPKRFAEKLKFVHLGERARAETVVEQRQPGLVERLVDEAIADSRYHEDFARTLFQLLVPHDFKEASSQMDRMWLALDEFTANLPWEMTQDGDRPLAVRTAIVRQLASTRYRTGVRPTLDSTAYVVGNPSTDGFDKVFTAPPGKTLSRLESLPGAEQEATTVVDTLQRNNFRVDTAIGETQRALDVINKLYQKPYRILHIAAHGVVDQEAHDGCRRSGVVLSNGLLITAAEIRAMKIVPDLVFLNCCHQGRISAEGQNRLAASVSRELIEIGVRAVVAAGWAVDDQAAALFAQTLYEAMVVRNVRFGDAVLEARGAAFEQFPHSNTFGAYQAYGDPQFVINPREKPGRGAGDGSRFVAAEELVDALLALRQNLKRRNNPLSAEEAFQERRKIEELSKECPSAWLDLPHVQATVANAYSELGPAYFSTACDYYRKAVGAHDKSGRVPIEAIQQLANLETRAGEVGQDLALIQQGIDRLQELRKLVSVTGSGKEAEGRAEGKEDAERASLIAAGYKRKAAYYAGQLKEGPNPALSKLMTEALNASIEWYGKAEGPPDNLWLYPALNGLQLEAVKRTRPPDQALMARAVRCMAVSRDKYRQSGDGWDAIGHADAKLTEYLLSQKLADAGEPGEQAAAELIAAYRELFETVHITLKQRDSVVNQMRSLGTLFEGQKGRNAGRVAARLAGIAEALDA